MRCPVNFVAVTQEKTNFHNGLDMGFYSKSHHNQPIMSADDGEVIYFKKQIRGGYTIKIKHSNNIVTTYGHLLKNSQTVKVGMKVKMGEMIARMGKSGIVTGEHLHFSIQKNGKYSGVKELFVYIALCQALLDTYHTGHYYYDSGRCDGCGYCLVA